jgi:hypothetical protein
VESSIEIPKRILKIELAYDPTFPLLGIHQKKTQSQDLEDALALLHSLC